MINESLEDAKNVIADFFMACLQKMPLHSYSLPELFRSFQFSSDKSFVSILFLVYI